MSKMDPKAITLPWWAFVGVTLTQPRSFTTIGRNVSIKPKTPKQTFVYIGKLKKKTGIYK